VLRCLLHATPISHQQQQQQQPLWLQGSHHMPALITAHVPAILFRMGSHPQLSVREHASECLEAFLVCSARLGACQRSSCLAALLNELSPNTADVPLLQDYPAEGLLSMVQLCLPAAPKTADTRSSLPLPSPPVHNQQCDVLYGVLERYLDHDASSVRQRASSVLSTWMLQLYPDRTSSAVPHDLPLLQQLCQRLLLSWPISSMNSMSAPPPTAFTHTVEPAVHLSLPPQLAAQSALGRGTGTATADSTSTACIDPTYTIQRWQSVEVSHI